MINEDIPSPRQTKVLDQEEQSLTITRRTDLAKGRTFLHQAEKSITKTKKDGLCRGRTFLDQDRKKNGALNAFCSP